LSHSLQHPIYKARAKTNPPTIATPPETTFATAAPVEVAAAGVVTEVADPEVVGVVFGVTTEDEVTEDETVPLVEGALELDPVLLEDVDTLPEVEVVDAVYAVLLVTETVVVEAAEPVAEEELELARPEMWNGKLYWKIVVSSSRESLKP
jgi:hypothetical protein